MIRIIIGRTVKTRAVIVHPIERDCICLADSRLLLDALELAYKKGNK